MEEEGIKKQKLIPRRRKRKGTPTKLVLPDLSSISESSNQRPDEYFSKQEGLHQNIIGGNFVAQMFIVKAGEDIIVKILLHCGSCCYNSSNSCNAYIVSAVGSVARASIRQGANVLTYEGLYGIVSLTGHVRVCSTHGDSYQVMVSLADTNHTVFGGYAANLVAATNIQIVLLMEFTDPPSDETSEDPASKTKAREQETNIKI
ncbi:hypothetical protein CCACVL1_04793 [Corchorus capsularis]|uniref:AT-hook motif nuclear-localized protein n=1 Tax=Corchorus capsularis TaxID=210143 RepID=A0A1R3JPF9_COCAP|nr:hypothetical protein CCACVL1_04793 [Corchorus capsularis]